MAAGLNTVVDTPIGELTEHPDNPRTISDAAMARLCLNLARDPDMLRARPIIALPDGTVIAGNMRLRAARRLGWATVPVFRADLDTDRAREWALRDNVSFGEWDATLLMPWIDGLVDGIGSVGFSDADLRALTASADNARPVGAEPVAVDLTPPAEPVTQLGDIIRLGRHTLVCGDSTDLAVMQLAVDPRKAACVWTDPPYGVDYASAGKRMIAERKGVTLAAEGVKPISGDTAGGLRGLLDQVLANIIAVSIEGAPVYIAHPSGPTQLVFMEAMRDAGVPFRQQLIWVKQNFVLGRSDYHYQHEPILMTYTPGEGRHGRGGSHWYGDNAQSSVFNVDRANALGGVGDWQDTIIRDADGTTRANRHHPTMKPVALVELMIANSTKRGDIVLDPFGGSGTTLIACEHLDRTCAMIELEPAYCDVIRRRFGDPDVP